VPLLASQEWANVWRNWCGWTLPMPACFARRRSIWLMPDFIIGPFAPSHWIVCPERSPDRRYSFP
jgi:hypothetical protein